MLPGLCLLALGVDEKKRRSFFSSDDEHMSRPPGEEVAVMGAQTSWWSFSSNEEPISRVAGRRERSSDEGGADVPVVLRLLYDHKF